MNLVVAGGTGFLGKKLTGEMVRRGHSLTVLTRSPQRLASSVNLRAVQWDAETDGPWRHVIDSADAVINLTGELIAGKRWTKKQKDVVLNSRVRSTRALVAAIERSLKRPSTLINVSAVGYYGNVPQGDVTERSPGGIDFLAGVCAQWEAEAYKTEKLGVRVLTPRLGVILAADGGALQRLAMPFRLFVGGYLGTGRQWFPWVHIDDVVNAFLFLLEQTACVGPVNIAAPEPVTMKEFTEVLGRVMHRPSWTAVPSFVLRVVLGEMSEMLLTGQRVVPRKLLDAGFEFRYANLERALSDLLSNEG